MNDATTNVTGGAPGDMMDVGKDGAMESRVGGGTTLTVARRRWTLTRISLLLVLVCAQWASMPALAQQTPQRSITQVTEHVYRWGENNFYGAFIVTDEGIILIDTITRPAATWLKAELSQRFGKPVKYVVLSHDHAIHITGADLFLDTATIIGHENIVPHIIAEKVSTAVPDLTFRNAAQLELGGVRVELIHDGQSHGDSLVVVRVPQDRVVIAIDLVWPDHIPPDLRDYHVHGGMHTIERVLSWDFDYLVTSHGRMGTRDDLRRIHSFLDTLFRQVHVHVREGKSLDEIKKLVNLESFRDWDGFDESVDANIETMYSYVLFHRDPTSKRVREPYPPPGPQ